MNDYFMNFFFGACNKDIQKDARLKKNVSWWNIFCELVNLVANRFRPVEDTFPETMDWRFLMMCLINNNKAGIVNGEDGNVYNGNIIGGSNFSRYGYLINCSVIDFMGKPYGSKFIPNTPGLEDVANCGIVYLNELQSRPITRIIESAITLSNLRSSISAAISNLKGTTVISCEKEQERAVRKAWIEADEGVPVILSFNGANSFGNKPELLCNPQTGDVLKVLLEAYDKELARFCGRFGIHTNQILNKMSGISELEMRQNEQKDYIILNSDLSCLNKYFNKVNKMFGTKIEIEINEDIDYNSDEELKGDSQNVSNDGRDENISGTGE